MKDESAINDALQSTFCYGEGLIPMLIPQEISDRFNDIPLLQR